MSDMNDAKNVTDGFRKNERIVGKPDEGEKETIIYQIAGISEDDLYYALEDKYDMDSPVINEMLDTYADDILADARQRIWDMMDSMGFGQIENDGMVEAFRKVASDNNITLP